MARYLRNYLYLPSWMSRFLIILAVPALGQDSGDSSINICGTHNSTYTNTTDIHKNSETTNSEICQCDVHASGSFQAVISFGFPQTVVVCGEGFTIHIQGQFSIQRCSNIFGAYSEIDQAYYPNGYVQIIYKSSGKEAISGWFRAKITASGRMIHVVCNINKAENPPSQPGPGSPGDATTAQPPVGPEHQSSPPPGTGQEKELTTPSGPGSGDQPPQTSRPGSGDQPPPTPSPGSGDQPLPSPSPGSGDRPPPSPSPGSGDQPPPTPSPGSGDQPFPTPSRGSGDQPPHTPAAGPGNKPSPPSGTGPGNESTPPPSPGSGNEPPPPPSPGSGNEPPPPPSPGSGNEPPPSPGSGNEPPPPPSPGSGNEPPPPSDHLRRTIMIAVIAVSTIVSVAGLIGIAVVCFRRRKRAPNVANGRHEQQVHYTKNKRND